MTLAERGAKAAVARAGDPLLERTLGRPRGLKLIFGQMAKEFVPAAAEGFTGDIIYLLRGLDGNVRAWTVRVGPAAARPVPGRASQEPALTISLGLADFLRLSVGEVDPVALVMDGRMELQGDFAVAAKLGPMFGRPLP
jgi:SCP-2 sterol transfer family